MHVTQNANHQIKPYPKLMFNAASRLLVLMTGESCGTVIDPGSSTWKIGDYFEDFSRASFQDAEGQFIISNDPIE